jgi:hypothetical protein
MAGAAPLLLAIAVGEQPAQVVEFPVTWAGLPPHIRDFHKRVLAGHAVYAAWNASFDREMWNQTTDFPELDPEHVIDVMAQATAAGLPGALDAAGRASRAGRKAAAGKDSSSRSEETMPPTTSR